MADPTSLPQDRVRVFARDGSPLAEFRASVDRSWAIGTEGRAQFQYASRKTDIVSQRGIEIGNYLLVENDQLPPWVGVIDPPRPWGTRVVTVSAYTCERVFFWRIGPTEKKLTGSAGQMFEELVNFVNAQEGTPLRAGNIWQGGEAREETINPTHLNEDLQRIYERSGEEYAFRPATDANGNLIVYCDWTAQLGTYTGILLHEGKGGGNIEAAGSVLVEDEPIYNDVMGYGEGATWASKPIASARDETSVGRYGLRQHAEEYSGVTETNTLRVNAEQTLLLNKNPLRTFRLNALNVGDTFKYLGMGNIFELRMESVGLQLGGLGLQATVRITGMRYNPDTQNKVDLVVEELL